MSKFLEKSREWAMRPEALKTLNQLEELGFDKDLSLYMLEKMLPNESIYYIGDEGDDF